MVSSFFRELIFLFVQEVSMHVDDHMPLWWMLQFKGIVLQGTDPSIWVSMLLVTHLCHKCFYSWLCIFLVIDSLMFDSHICAVASLFSSCSWSK
jgi:hypothetical protein